MSPLPHAPTELTSADTTLRAQYLDEVLGLLYPESGDDGAVLASYIAIPDARKPKLLVPAADRRIAAAAVARYAEPTSRAAQAKRRAAIVALRTGADRVLLRDRITVTGRSGCTADSIDSYLAKVLGGALSISVHIGPARANRKPVIQLISADGQTIGFGKIGVGPLTQELVRAETRALTTMSQAELPGVTVPRVLHAGVWRGHEILVQSALPVWAPRTKLSTKRLTAAMHEVARSAGTHTGPLAADVYWKTLRTRLDALTDGGLRSDGSDPAGEARSLALAADELVARGGDTELTYGSWHGDWSPWNMATTGGGLLLWDWERFTQGVPLGFDAIHFDLQRLLTRGIEPDIAVDTTVGRADRLLAPFDIEPEAATLTALLYLVDLAARYLADRQAEAGARLGVLGSWLLPVLMGKVAGL
ncbi:MAG TPA: hypothetical protein VGJ28_26450 [Micromonosporaceae bacterium]|jgi:hypothetical protein